MDFFTSIETRLILEKLIIGLEENVEILKVGKFAAKVDSGNSGYNVIHGEDIKRLNGGIITFFTRDKDNKKIFISRKIDEMIRINIGSGHIEDRPVIKFDVKIGDAVYKNISFSIADRTNSDFKILICKDFIEKELDALVDVSRTYIADKGLDAQINESRIIKGAMHTAGNALRNNKVARGLSWVKDKVKSIGIDDHTGKEKWYSLNNILLGMQAAGKFTDAALKNSARDKEYADLAEEDADLIRQTINNSTDLPKKYQLNKVDQTNSLIYKEVDYLGKYYKGGDKPVPVEQEHYNQYHKLLQELAEADKKSPQTGNENQQQVAANEQQQTQSGNQTTQNTDNTAQPAATTPAQQPTTTTPAGKEESAEEPGKKTDEKQEEDKGAETGIVPVKSGTGLAVRPAIPQSPAPTPASGQAALPAADQSEGNSETGVATTSSPTPTEQATLPAPAGDTASSDTPAGVATDATEQPPTTTDPNVQQETTDTNAVEGEGENLSDYNKAVDEAKKKRQELQNLQKLYDDRRQFCFYFVEIGSRVASERSAHDKNITAANDSIGLVNILNSFFSGYSPSFGAKGDAQMQPKLVQPITQGYTKNKAPIYGVCAVCWGELQHRLCHVWKNEAIIGIAGSADTNQPLTADELEKKIDNLSSEGKTMGHEAVELMKNWSSNMLLQHEPLSFKHETEYFDKLVNAIEAKEKETLQVPKQPQKQAQPVQANESFSRRRHRRLIREADEQGQTESETNNEITLNYWDQFVQDAAESLEYIVKDAIEIVHKVSAFITQYSSKANANDWEVIKMAQYTPEAALPNQAETKPENETSQSGQSGQAGSSANGEEDVIKPNPEDIKDAEPKPDQSQADKTESNDVTIEGDAREINNKTEEDGEQGNEPSDQQGDQLQPEPTSTPEGEKTIDQNGYTVQGRDPSREIRQAKGRVVEPDQGDNGNKPLALASPQDHLKQIAQENPNSDLARMLKNAKLQEPAKDSGRETPEAKPDEQDKDKRLQSPEAKADKVIARRNKYVRKNESAIFYTAGMKALLERTFKR